MSTSAVTAPSSGGAPPAEPRLDLELAVMGGWVDLLLDHAERASGIAERRHALDALTRGLLGADPGTVDEAARARARALSIDESALVASSAERLPHAVAVPFAHGAFGLVRQVHVTYDPLGLRAAEARLGASARTAVAGALEAAARVFPPGAPLAHHHLVPVESAALAGARVDGPSLGAGAFVSAAALFSGREVRAEVAATGALKGEAVIAVGDIPAKVEGACAAGLEALIVPHAERAEAERSARGRLAIISVADLGALVEATLRPGRPARAERAMEQARALFARGWSGYRWPSIGDHLARLDGTLPEGRLDLRVELLARLAATRRHLGDPVGSRALLGRALSIASSPEGRVAVPDLPLTVLHQQRAMTAQKLCLFGEAAKAASEAVRIARRARLRGELIKGLGCQGLVAMARGRSESAVEAFEASLEVGLLHQPGDNARTRAYLLEALGAAGREAEAREAFRLALEEVDRADDASARASKEAWVRTSFAAALRSLALESETVEVLDAPAVESHLGYAPLPGLLARRHLGLALAATGREARGFALLAASPIAHGPALAPHFRFLAHLNVLFEARARLRAGAFDADAAARAHAALAHVPRYGRAASWLGAPLASVERSLESRGRPNKRALDKLLERCARLG